MKFLYALALGLFALAPITAHAAPYPVGVGGTGSTTLSGILTGNGTSPIKTLLIGAGLSLGSGTLSSTVTASPATSTNPLMGTYVVATGTPTSTFLQASTSIMSLAGSYITNFVNDVRALFSSGTGVDITGGTLSFDCSDVEGAGINCTGESITLDNSGDWAGTFDSQEGTFYLARANHTGTQAASTITGGTFGAGSFVFPSGFLSVASTTVGGGDITTGLTINGGATTTGPAYFAGNLGIGTTSPFTDLSVVGNGLISGGLNVGDTATAPVAGGLLFARAGTSEPFIRFRTGNGNTAGSQIRGINGGGIRFTNDTGGAEFIRITSTGSVGIGTTTPWATLSVISSPTSTVPPFLVASSSSSTVLAVTPLGGTSVGSSTPGTTCLFCVGTTTPKLFIDKTGKIGIGNVNNTPSPISFGSGSNINVNPNIFLLVQDTSDARIGACVNDVCTVIKNDGGIYRFDYANGIPGSMNFQEFAGGQAKVGIATSTPWGKFSVVNSATTTGPVFVLASSSAATTSFMVMTATGTALFGNPSAATYCPGCINAKAVFDDNTLLTDWLFDLYFDGKVRPEDQKYANKKLLSINETREFAEKERHLPTIVGRNEWSGNFSLGAMVTQLWETVEALSTHVWELADWNEAQDREIKKLQDENAALKARLNLLELRLNIRI